MSLLLDRPAIRARVHRMSVEDYHRMGEMGMIDESHELLRGYIVKKMAKSPLHTRIFQKLLMQLIRTVPAGVFVRPEQPVTIGESEPEPDFSVVRGDPDHYARRHPTTAELVIEIAVSSLEEDSGESGHLRGGRRARVLAGAAGAGGGGCVPFAGGRPLHRAHNVARHGRSPMLGPCGRRGKARRIVCRWGKLSVES